MARHGLPFAFPEEVTAEADAIDQTVVLEDAAATTATVSSLRLTVKMPKTLTMPSTS